MNEQDGPGFGGGLLIGAVLGLIVGLLLAPQAGEATQEQLLERSRRWRERAQGWAGEAQHAAEQARQSEAWRRGSEALSDTNNPLGRAVSEGRQAWKRTQREIDERLAGKEAEHKGGEAAGHAPEAGL